MESQNARHECRLYRFDFGHRCFGNLTAARATVARYIEHYNPQRTYSALKYNTPRQTSHTLCKPTQKQAA